CSKIASSAGAGWAEEGRPRAASRARAKTAGRQWRMRRILGEYRTGMTVREALLLLLCVSPLFASPASLADALPRARTLMDEGDRPRAPAELMQALRAHPSHPVTENCLG